MVIASCFFSQLYCETWEQNDIKKEREKKVESGQNGILFKVVNKVIVKEIDH